MSETTSHRLDERLSALNARWQDYVARGGFEQFVEFSVALNSLAEQLGRLRLPGLLRISEGLENAALARFGDPESHPLAAQEISALQRQVDALTGAITSSRRPVGERRVEEVPSSVPDPEWVRPRAVWVMATPDSEMTNGLAEQLNHFGFRPQRCDWHDPLPEGEQPLAVLFIGDAAPDQERQLERVAAVRQAVPASQLFYLGAERAMESVVLLMRAGIDITVPREEGVTSVLTRILDLVQTREQEKYRVLIVEDSRVAAVVIQRTLAEHSIDSLVVADPGTLLDAVGSYRPDLILMDMYMPRFNGVEATRVLRQVSGYQALPIVYLSSESDIGMQVEALRLGGDQFLTKPFNPVVLAAVVRTKIERYRDALRSTRTDGLTGLLNHTASKARLKAMVESLPAHGNLCVAMLDIDHFKAINDTYGHPVGDQVIRNLAWLLKGRLRATDLIGRYGGEEFILALPDAPPERAHAVIERIRRDFAVLPHAHNEGTLYSTFSAGLACSLHYPTAAELTEAADHALLEAKRQGRNQVVAACMQ
ncbi:diguanylate cyclase [Azospira restricta]|uniref:diguanylate cyclase n=1 Tax=Azospira restricta TaxID=404405 RepID=A0A974PX38_9RHOO|nr:diguanylate cyclase [Azospira restricta]QRJ62839.1 diguanylate cyclase [Azospira restricta]